MKATARVELGSQHVTITLEASELDEFRLLCEIRQAPQVRYSDGEPVAPEYVRILCSSGFRAARHLLALPKGLSMTIFEVSGVVDRSGVVGICQAAAIAIARSLKRDEHRIVASLNGWTLAFVREDDSIDQRPSDGASEGAAG